MSKHSIGIYVWLYSQTAYMQMKNGGDHSSSDRWAERGSILIQTSPRGGGGGAIYKYASMVLTSLSSMKLHFICDTSACITLKSCNFPKKYFSMLHYSSLNFHTIHTAQGKG